MLRRFSNSSIVLSPDQYFSEKSIHSVISYAEVSSLGIWTVFPSSSKSLIENLINEDRNNYPKLKIYESFYNFSNIEDLVQKLKFYLNNISTNVTALIINIPNSNIKNFINQTYLSTLHQTDISIIIYNDDDAMSSFLPPNNEFFTLYNRPSLMVLRNLPNSMRLQECSNLLGMTNGEFSYINTLGYCSVANIPERMVLAFLSVYYAMMGIVNTRGLIAYNSVTCGSSDEITNGTLLTGFVKEILSKNGLFNNVYMQSTSTNDYGNVTVFIPTVSFNRSLQNVSIYQSKVFSNKFYSFFGKTLILETVLSKPFSFAGTTTADGFMGNVTGYTIDLLDEMARRLNFTYKLKAPADNQFGTYGINGWNGMIKDILLQKTDFAVGSFTITSNRTSAVDFTDLYLVTGMGILIARPKYQTNIFKLLTPFDLSSWLMIIVSVFVVGFMTFVISYYSPLSEWNLNNGAAIRDEVVLFENIWAATGSFLMQGQDFYPRANSARIVLGFWFLFTILIIATYNADLTAYLTSRIPESSIQSLEDLANSPTMKPLIKAGTNAFPLFALAAPHSIYGRIYSKMKDMPNIFSNDIAIQMVENDSNWAYIADLTQLTYYKAKQCEKFTVLPVRFNVAGYGWPLRKGSIYKDAFNEGFAALKESGFMSKLEMKWWQSSTICSKQNIQTSTLTIDETGGVFIFLAMFIAMGAIILLFERFLFKLKKDRTIKTNEDQ